MAKNRPGYGKKQSPLNRLIEQGLVKPYDPAKFEREGWMGVPRGWALCCPFCETYKMKGSVIRAVPGAVPGFVCLGGTEHVAPMLNREACGKFISKEEADAHRALYIVEE